MSGAFGVGTWAVRVWGLRIAVLSLTVAVALYIVQNVNILTDFIAFSGLAPAGREGRVGAGSGRSGVEVVVECLCLRLCLVHGFVAVDVYVCVGFRYRALLFCCRLRSVVVIAVDVYFWCSLVQSWRRLSSRCLFFRWGLAGMALSVLVLLLLFFLLDFLAERVFASVHVHFALSFCSLLTPVRWLVDLISEPRGQEEAARAFVFHGVAATAGSGRAR
jgi:hypothetical protein